MYYYTIGPDVIGTHKLHSSLHLFLGTILGASSHSNANGTMLYTVSPVHKSTRGGYTYSWN